MRDRLILIGVVGFASGILCRSLFEIPWPVTAVIAVVALGSFLLWRLRATFIYGAVSVLFIFLAIGAYRTALVPSEPPAEFMALIGHNVDLEGIIIRDPDIRESTARLTVEVMVGNEQTRFIAVTQLYPEHVYGERIHVRGKLTAPEPFETDGGRVFQYDRFLRKDGLYGVVDSAQVETIQAPTGLYALFGSLYELKQRFADGMEAAIVEPYASLGIGIVAGGKQGLGKDLLDAFTIAGLLPIIVLSGYNVMIVAEAVMRSLRFMPKRAAVLIATIVIALFVLAAGAGASAVRAGIMAGVGLFARASGRTYDAIRALVAVFVFMLLMNPYLLAYDPGFGFSFAATLGLIIGAPVIEPYLMRLKNAFLRDILATTVAAQLFVLPLLLYQTGNLSLVSVPANLLVLPVIPFAMLFSGVAGFVGILMPVLATVVGVPALLLLGYVVWVAEIAARLPFSHIIIPAFPFVFVIVAYVLLMVLMSRLESNAPLAGQEAR